MAKNIYVGNLVWDTNQDDLCNLFKEFGQVARAQIISDKETGRSRGFGFVEMENDSEAENAIAALNGQPFKGRNLTVNEAKPREPRAPRSFGGRPGGTSGDRQRAPRRGGNY
jgi:cold-inducible RNA-binding protein